MLSTMTRLLPIDMHKLSVGTAFESTQCYKYFINSFYAGIYWFRFKTMAVRQRAIMSYSFRLKLISEVVLRKTVKLAIEKAYHPLSLLNAGLQH